MRYPALLKAKGRVKMLNNIFGPDSLVILAVVMLLFGPKNLPKLSKSIGSSIRELKKGLNGAEDEEESVARPTAPATPAQVEQKSGITHDSTGS